MNTHDEDMPGRNADLLAEERSRVLDHHELETVSGGGNLLGTLRAPHLWQSSNTPPASPVSSESSESPKSFRTVFSESPPASPSSAISELSLISHARSDFANSGDAAINAFAQRYDARDELKASLRRTKSNPSF
jgi:hypothetical protein